jgi:hypothetical protein
MDRTRRIIDYLVVINHPVLVLLVHPVLVHLSPRDRAVVHSHDLLDMMSVGDESDKDQT